MPLPKSFTDLVNNLTILPGVGEKTAERFVYSLYEKDMDEVENLAESLIEFKKTIKNCIICGCLSDEEKCEVCQDNSRDKKTICIVEDSKNVFFIEKTKKYDILLIDGVKVFFNDGSALVRASNTGPNITMRFEAKTEERLEKIKQEFMELVEELRRE